MNKELVKMLLSGNRDDVFLALTIIIKEKNIETYFCRYCENNAYKRLKSEKNYAADKYAGFIKYGDDGYFFKFSSDFIPRVSRNVEYLTYIIDKGSLIINLEL